MVKMPFKQRLFTIENKHKIGKCEEGHEILMGALDSLST